jgi:hypothetical protein
MVPKLPALTSISASPVFSGLSRESVRLGKAKRELVKTIVKQKLDNCQEAGDGKGTPMAWGEYASGHGGQNAERASEKHITTEVCSNERL